MAFGIKKYDIFISYRKGDGKGIARMVKESLAHRGYRVFLDYDEVKDGIFDKTILDAIDSAPVYVLILTAHCLNRCSNADDWIRLELEHAISAKKKIIPINPDKQFTGFPDDFPAHLRQVLELHQYTTLDTGQLYQASIDQLDKLRIRPSVRHRKWHWAAAAIAVLAVICGIVFLVTSSENAAQKYYMSALKYNGIGTSAYNIDSAQHWFSRSAEAGYPPAMRELAKIHQFRGEELQAYDWCRKAYLSGDTAAIALLGTYYQSGYGTVKDIAHALELYREGVEMHDNEAMYRYGLCLRDGVGMERDFVEGMRLIVQSGLEADNGCWVFEPAMDSARTKSTVIRAIHLSDSTTCVYLTWHNRRYFGGWMQVSPQACLTDVETGHKYPLKGVEGCKLEPDTTSVPFGTSRDFALIFPPLPSNVKSIDIIESDSSQWQWFGVKIAGDEN